MSDAPRAGSKVRSDPPAEVAAARAAAAGQAVTNPVGRAGADQEKARRTEALTLRLAGLSYDQIADRMNTTSATVQVMVQSTLERAENLQVDRMRDLENQRLDRAQAAIWSSVIQGDQKAIATFLQISRERAKLNGLYAPQKVDMSLSIRQEMMAALGELEAIVEGSDLQAIDAEVVE